MLNLRQGYQPAAAPDYLNRPTDDLYANYQGLDSAGAGSLRRGWVSTDIGIDAADAMTEAALAYSSGDTARGQFLEQQARDQAAQAQQWAPTVRNLEDIGGVGDALSYAGGHLTSGLRSTAGPITAGLGGALVGGAVGALTRNPGLAARAGSGVGAFSQGYDLETDEAVMSGMMDDKVRATRNYDDIINAGRVKGAASGALEAVVPTMVAGRFINGIGKGVLPNLVREAGTEALTEGTQNVAGQVTQNYLRQDPLSDIDGMQVVNAAAAGAIGGGGMSGIGAAGGLARDTIVGGSKKVADVARDPVGAVIDKMKGAAEAAGRKRAQDEIANTPTTLEAFMGERRPSITDQLSEDELGMDDAAVSQRRAQMSVEDAKTILTSPARTYGPRESELRAAAQQVVADDGKSWDTYRKAKQEFDDEDAALREVEQLGKAMGLEDSKASLMSPILTDDFGYIEGRDMSQDQVVDSAGRLRAGNPNPDKYTGMTDARTQSTNVSTTPYEGDTFDYNGAPNITASSAQPATFNYDSAQRSAGIQAAKDALKNQETPLHARVAQHINRIRSRTQGKSRESVEQVKADAQRVVGLADVLVNRGYYPPGVVNAAKSAAKKDALLTKAADLIMWARDGFFEIDPKKPTQVADALISQHGATDAATLIKASYEAGVKAGIVTPNPERMVQVEEYVASRAINDKMLGDNILANINPEYKHRVGSIATLIENLRQVLYVGKERRTKTESEIVNMLFPTDAQKQAVFEAFDLAFGTAIKGVGYGGQTTDPVLRNEGRDKPDTGTRTAAAVDKDGNGGRGSQLRDEREFGETTSESGNEMAPRSRSTYVRRQFVEKGANGVEVRRTRADTFDILDKKQKVQLQDTFDRELATASKDGGPVRVERVGVIDRALDEAALKANGELQADEKAKLIEEVVLKYRKDLTRPTAPPDSALPVTKRMYADSVRKFEQDVAKAAKGLNRRHLSVRRVELSADRVQGEIDIEAIMASERNVKLDASDNRPEKGTLVFTTVTKKRDGTDGTGHFIINAPQIMRLMFKQNGVLGDNGAVYQDGDKNAIIAGGPQVNGELLMEGITAILQHEKFTGVSYIENGKLVPITKGLPDNFKVVGDTTWADYKKSVNDYRKRSAESSKDSDPGDFDQRREMIAKSDNEVVGQISRQRSKLDAENQGRLKKFLARWYDEDTGLAFRKTQDARKVLKQWAEAVGVKFDIVAMNDGKGADGLDMSADVSGGLEAYTPKRTIQRDTKGVMTTEGDDNPQTVVGRSQPVDVKDAKKLGPATQKTPARAEDVDKATRTEEMRQKFVELLRDTLDNFVKGVKALSAEEVALFGNANTEFKKQLSEYPHAIAKGYFGGNVDKARMFVARFRKNTELIDATITDRRNETLSAKGRVGRESVEAPEATGRAAAQGTDAGTATGPVVQGAEGRPVRDESADDGQVAKQEAWVRKVAKLSVKDAVAYINGLPDAKLDRAFDLLDSFNDLDNPKQERVVSEALDAIRERLAARDEGTNDAKNSEQTTSPLDTPIDPKQALADIEQAFGKDFAAEVVAKLGGKSGQWTKHGIKLAASAPNGTQFHEMLHEFFSQLRKHGADNVRELIQRVATNPVMLRKMERLLHKHPKAVMQLKSPEEAAAFMYQFWQMGLLNIGPETKTLFETIKALVVKTGKKLLTLVDTAYREQYAAEKKGEMDADAAMDALSVIMSGKLAKPDTRDAIMSVLRDSTEAHDAALEQVGQATDKFFRKWGELLVSSEAMLKTYKAHPELKALADKFHQSHDAKMTNQAREGGPDAYGGVIEATGAETARWINRLNRELDGYSKEDLELARPHLEAGTVPTDRVAKEIAAKVRKYYDDFFNQVVVAGDVRRLDVEHPDRWVKVDKRADYWTQVWDTEAVINGRDTFLAKLHDLHSRELTHMAAEANRELDVWRRTGAQPTSPSAQASIDKDDADFAASGQLSRRANPAPVTPDMVAEQIYARLINSIGMIDQSETSWSMGITPGASAVNRRELNWLDKAAFSEFKSKDVINIMTTNTRSVVKRAEHQKRFGYGADVIADTVDTAFLRELGGEALLTQARDTLPSKIKAWKKAAAAWHKSEANAGLPYPEPYPTLRLVGFQLDAVKPDHNQRVIAAEKALRPAINSIMAMEGTLGADISPELRKFNSVVNSYTNLRVLPFTLFTNINDIIGLTVKGGSLSDAWDGLVTGMREIRNSWANEHSADANVNRAELWGVLEAHSALEALGQNYGSIYMTHGAKRFNDKFFRLIGMEGWNRGIRAIASRVGESIILDYAKQGIDSKKAGQEEAFERLYGEGATPSSIKLDSAGQLDINDSKNRAAIARFVQDAVMSSNSAVRPGYMSNPKYAIFGHLKNYAYAFHRVMLLGIVDQAKLGNYRPAMAAALGYAPVAIAAGAIKEMLIPGEEPYWMKQGLAGYLEYGYMQASLGGVPQMYMGDALDLDPFRMMGPFVDQVQNTLVSPIPGISVNLSPFKGETDILRDREWDVELAKAFPAGTVVSRAFKGE